MVEAFYKPEYKVYIFKGDDLNNEELLSAIDTSPTYKRTAQELEKIMEIAENSKKKAPAILHNATATDENENKINNDNSEE